MKIRQMSFDDLDFAVGCARNEGWLGETKEVFRGFLEVDPKGCAVAVVDGNPVGVCVAVHYGTYGFLGELIVLKEFRGRGYGRGLMEHCMDYLTKSGCTSIGLDGDEPATALYEKLGFAHVCKSLRFVGAIPGRGSSHVRPMIRADLERVAALDLGAFGADRHRYLGRRFGLFPELCKVLVLDDNVAGYIMAQPGVGVTSVGPWVVGPAVESPLDLLGSIATEVGDTPLRIGVLETNSRAVTLFRSAGTFEETTPSFRMIFGQETKVGMSDQLFAIGSAAKA